MCQLASVADTHDVDVGAGAVQEMVAEYTAHGVGLNPQLVSGVADYSVDRVIEYEIHDATTGEEVYPCG